MNKTTFELLFIYSGYSFLAIGLKYWVNNF